MMFYNLMMSPMAGLHLQGNWEFAERARQSIQDEEGTTTSRSSRTSLGRRYRTQSSLDKPLSNSALVEVDNFNLGTSYRTS